MASKKHLTIKQVEKFIKKNLGFLDIEVQSAKSPILDTYLDFFVKRKNNENPIIIFSSKTKEPEDIFKVDFCDDILAANPIIIKHVGLLIKDLQDFTAAINL